MKIRGIVITDRATGENVVKVSHAASVMPGEPLNR
jgi:hypothetical protein